MLLQISSMCLPLMRCASVSTPDLPSLAASLLNPLISANSTTASSSCYTVRCIIVLKFIHGKAAACMSSECMYMMYNNTTGMPLTIVCYQTQPQCMYDLSAVQHVCHFVQ
jgi:hypothetical protein